MVDLDDLFRPLVTEPVRPAAPLELIGRRARARRRRRTARHAALTVLLVAGITLALDRTDDRRVDTGPADVTSLTHTDDGWSVEEQGPLGARSGQVVVWTGTELVIWGGASGWHAEPQGDGAAWDPATGLWRPIAAGPLSARSDAVGVWTGRELLVVGGADERTVRNDGAVYDPATDTWRAITEMPRPTVPNGTAASALSLAQRRTALWTGDRLLLPAVGLAYDPAADRWEPIAPLDTDRYDPQTAVWTGTEAIVAGVSRDAAEPSVRAFAYRPQADDWRELSSPPLTATALSVAAAFDGERVTLVSDDLQAARYDLTSGSWEALPAIPLREYKCEPHAFTLDGRLYAQLCAGLAVLEDGRWRPFAYPDGIHGAGAAVPAGDEAFMWGSTYGVNDSRTSSVPLLTYTPARDTGRAILLGGATLTLPDGYATNEVRRSEPDFATAVISADLVGPGGTCTVASRRRGELGWAETYLSDLAGQLGARTEDRAGDAEIPADPQHPIPSYAVRLDPSTEGPVRLAWALDVTEVADIECADRAVLDTIAARIATP